jgi:hypothetical protein
VRVAYVVLSHRNPEQVLRLVAALKEGSASEVLVRHDGRHSRLDEADVERLGARTIEDEIEFEWGGWTQLQVLLSCLERTAAELDPDWLLVLSGQDYPLRPIDEIEEWLAGSEHDAMLGRVFELDTDRLPEPPYDDFFLRYAYRHYPTSARTPHLPRAVRPLVYLREMPAPIPPRLGLRRPRLPFGDGFRCLVSADWLTVNRKALGAVLAAARERRRLMRYYRRVAIPSESFFATVLLNDPALRVARDDRRYIYFAEPLAPHPETLTRADLDRLVASECYLARKFDVEADAEVLDALDERRRSRSPR